MISLWDFMTSLPPWVYYIGLGVWALLIFAALCVAKASNDEEDE